MALAAEPTAGRLSVQFSLFGDAPNAPLVPGDLGHIARWILGGAHWENGAATIRRGLERFGPKPELLRGFCGTCGGTLPGTNLYFHTDARGVNLGFGKPEQSYTWTAVARAVAILWAAEKLRAQHTPTAD